MSFFQKVVEIGFSGLSDKISNELLDIGKKDKTIRNLINQLTKEENALLEMVKAAAKQNPGFDEEPYRKMAQCLVKRRLLLVQMIEDQLKSNQLIYDHLDSKITHFDNCVKQVSPNFQNLSTHTKDTTKKKKKRKSTAVPSQEDEDEDDENNMIDIEFEEAISAVIVDPNEPLYCICKRISFGQMIACENLDCPIEWFHFSCVGLKKEPADSWYCPQCRIKQQQQQQTHASSSSSSTT